MKYGQSLILLLFCTFSCNSWAFQNCEIPLVINLSNTSSTSVDVEWIDFNDNTISFDFELVEFSESQTSNPTITGITGTNTTISGLSPASAYELFIRAQCPDGASEWNGPYNFNTNLTASANCNLNFQISDDQCPDNDAFYFENDLTGLLGENLFIESVDVVIEHNWPPDLKLQIVSPAGVKVDLLSHLGINSQNLGDPDMPCQQTLSFSDRACEYIRDANFPINGLYEPEMPLENLYDGTEGSGNWSLEICDRADGDIGTLKQFAINFSQGACYPPGEITLSQIGGTFVEIDWNSPSCDELEVVFGPEPFNPATASVSYVDCNDQFFRITGLQEDIDYVFFINTICALETFENECPIFLHTECANPSLDLNFDDLDPCEESCDEPCDLNNDFWFNSRDDDVDWLINSDRTPTSFTGPEGDLKGNGNYIYVDAASSTCGDFLFASIESECINIKSNANGCDLSFYYYMFGVDIGSLGIDISLNNGEDWTNLWSNAGDQGRLWQQTVVDLSAYDNQVGIFRIYAETAGGNFGDIAIDEIKLYSSLIAQPLDIFYEDLDGDGFGNRDRPFQFCAITTPPGFANNSDDCNDDNPSINPSINESPCNLIDDNCDLQIDEPNSNPLEYVGDEIQSASCSGNKDAIVEVMVVGGIPPYDYVWSDGETENPNINVNPGIFQCTITDQGGCVLISDFIVVDAEKELVFTVEEINNNQCIGAFSDGSIDINIEGGTAPYQFGWSHGYAEQNPFDLESGEYIVSITDNNNCSFISEPIFVGNEIEIKSEVLINKSTSCIDEADGELFVSATGGTSPYTYSWSHGVTGNQAQDLTNGYYGYTVTDAQNCSFIVDSIFVDSPKALDIRIDAIESNLCNSENEGIILTTPIGGTAPYTFFWSNGENTDDLKSLENGTYNLTVNDSNGCTAAFENIMIQSPPEIEITIEVLTNETCRSGQDGYISVQSNGGSGNYNYNWSNGATNINFISDLESGIYAVTVIDDFGCKQSLNNIIILEENIDLPVNVAEVNEITCFGNDDGSLTASAAQGTFPYDYNWSNGTQNIGNFSNDTIENVAAGLYNLTVTDGLGCTGVSEFIELTESSMITYNISKEDILCLNPGKLSLSIDGGDPAYQVAWSNGETGQEIQVSQAGLYSATITDSNNCSVVTNETNILALGMGQSVTNITHATSSSLGSYEIEFVTGSGPYTFFLDDVEQGVTDSGFIYENLEPGDYEISVIGSLGCQLAVVITIDLIDAITETQFENKYNLYPNPSNGTIFLEGKNLESSEISVVNLHGQSIKFTISHQVELSEIALTNAASGIYLVLINEQSKTYIKKVVLAPN